MIHKEVLIQKKLSLRKSAFLLFQEVMKNYSVREEKCPHCHETGKCVRHAWYLRNLIDYEKGEGVIYRQIKVLRVRCLCCRHTHSVLPDCIIPYTTYSLFFILRIFITRIFMRNTILKICRQFHISVSMFYRWRLLFKEHIKNLPEKWSYCQSSEKNFLTNLLHSSYSAFESSFFIKNQYSFLQNHKYNVKNSN